MTEVKAWEETVTIPTYGIGKPEKNPIFLEKRVYQGSSGAVYPHPVIEKIEDEKREQDWKALFLENQYLKVMILPELGGRIQMAYDKTKQRHFVYYNRVIKPALVGLTGPWISGGIEFNWPQHHRPSTYEPVDYSIEENADGSKTVWCSEIERMFRTRGMIGFTMYPDKAYLELRVKLYNRTPFPQTFLWWANPAVHVNDEYQSVFPPDVNAVFDHGKRDVSRFPVATGTYYKMDYSAGVDISRYKNIPVPTSYMAIRSDYDFVGGYENDTKGGLLHVANHHVSPGKKQWTWGNGDFGKAWDRNLTDEDGPYIELMCGVFTDNQPDFSWIMPYEERAFTQYFMPYRDLGVVKNATKEAMVNLEFSNDKAIVKAYTTAKYPGTRVTLEVKGKNILSEDFDFSPETSYERTVVVDPSIPVENYSVSLTTSNGKALITWQPEKAEIRPIPEAAKAAKLPKEIASMEQLYLTGLHLEQYRHATYPPTDYYKEALEREPGDVRNNNAMGLWYMRRGKFGEAEPYFRAAIATLTERNPNPYDGEPYFNLGMCLRMQYKYTEAFEAFYKAVWNVAWQDSGYFQLAQIACILGKFEEALDLVDKSLIRNWHNHKSRHLKVAILRVLEQKEAALSLIEDSIKIDRFNFGLYFERFLLTGDVNAAKEMKLLMRGYIHNYIEIALDYGLAGLFDTAISFLSTGIEQHEDVYPMAWYYMGWFANQNKDPEKAIEYYKKAAQANPDYCFPNQHEAVLALQNAIKMNASDAKAPYYLGIMFYNWRWYPEATAYWENSVRLDEKFPTVHRNLALAYYNKQNNAVRALASMEKAFSLDKTDARILMELDQLYKKLNYTPDRRLKTLETHLDLVMQRDDLYLEQATLYNSLKQYQKAYDLIMKRKFHPWEGGEGKVTGQYIISLVEMAKEAIRMHEFTKALEYLEKAKIYPENLGEGKLYGAQENDIHYWLGCAYEGNGDRERAKTYWEMASTGLSEPAQAFFYNDQQPDKIFYQGMALGRLGKVNEARSRFNKLIDYGEKHIFDTIRIDYFAVSLPDLLIWDDDLSKRNKIHCYYLMGLGHLGLNHKQTANGYFDMAHNLDLNHQMIVVHKELANAGVSI